MRVLNLFVVLVVTVVFASVAAAATLAVKSKEGVGSYLTDEKGMTLYLFKKDSPGKSVCVAAGGCLERWPVFYADKFEPAAGINNVDISVITREDGKKQSTYKGLPLYYFFKDKTAGDTLGQGVNSVWYVVAP